MKRWIKSIVFFCLYYSGLEWLLARLVPVHAVAILMYHGVADHSPMPSHINFHLDRDTFQRQMRALKRRYRVVPLNDVVATLARGERLEEAVVLTFDDGYQNNARYVAPLLKSLGLPFTVFVATAYVDAQTWIPLNRVYCRWSEGKLSDQEMAELRAQLRGRPSAEAPQILGAIGDRPVTASPAAEESFAMMSWEAIRELAAAGVEFGSHTQSHCNMSVETEAQQLAELRGSKELLETHLGCQVGSFAYPYGYMNETARHSVIEAGYECALSTEYGLVTSRSDRFRLPRLGNDKKIWFFVGEILYQFAKQAAKDVWSGAFGQVVAGTPTENRHG